MTIGGMSEHYVTEDAILSQLTLSNPCRVDIEVTQDRIRLQVGQRDFDWKRGCPDLSGSGTMLCEPGEEMVDEPGGTEESGALPTPPVTTEGSDPSES